MILVSLTELIRLYLGYVGNLLEKVSYQMFIISAGISAFGSWTLTGRHLKNLSWGDSYFSLVALCIFYSLGIGFHLILWIPSSFPSEELWLCKTVLSENTKTVKNTGYENMKPPHFAFRHYVLAFEKLERNVFSSQDFGFFHPSCLVFNRRCLPIIGAWAGWVLAPDSPPAVAYNSLLAV